MNQIIDNNARVLSAARYQTRIGGSLMVVMGVVFVVLASWSWTRGADMVIIALFGLLGILMMIDGFRRLGPKARYPRIDNPSEPTGRDSSWS